MEICPVCEYKFDPTTTSSIENSSATSVCPKCESLFHKCKNPDLVTGYAIGSPGQINCHYCKHIPFTPIMEPISKHKYRYAKCDII